MKKLSGLLLNFLGLILALSVLRSIPTIFSNFLSLFSADNTALSAGESTGFLIGKTVIAIIAFFCFKYGVKLFTSNKKPQDIQDQ